MNIRIWFIQNKLWRSTKSFQSVSKFFFISISIIINFFNKKVFLYKKTFFSIKHNISNNNHYFSNCFYIVSDENSKLTRKQLDSCINSIRFYIRKYKKKGQSIFVNRVPLVWPITKKVKHSRMGTGKGKIMTYVAQIRKNSILFIFRNLNITIMLKIYKQLKYKLPVKIYLK